MVVRGTNCSLTVWIEAEHLGSEVDPEIAVGKLRGLFRFHGSDMWWHPHERKQMTVTSGRGTTSSLI